MTTLPTGTKRSDSSCRAGSRGFTLIEFILVMTLLLIVFSVTGPSLSNFFRGRTLNSEARRFLSLTRYGQSRAVSEGAPMLLWLNQKEGTYGLEPEAVELEPDVKDVVLELNQYLEFEIVNSTVPRTASMSSGQNAAARTQRRNLPAIRFLPDGFISETSPQSVVIRETNHEPTAVWISLSRNRLNYEIETNALHTVAR